MKSKTIQITRNEALYLCEALEGMLEGNLFSDGLDRPTTLDTLAAWKRQRKDFIESRRKHYESMDPRLCDGNPSRQAELDRKIVDREARMLARIYPFVAA